MKKTPLPKYGKILGHNNEVQLCLILRIEKADLARRIQVMVVNRVYLDMEINKEEREKEEKKLGIKKRIKLEFDRINPPKEK